MIRIWRAYSCNNSSSYRLVARFADAATASAVAVELTEFLAQHAKEIDAQPADPQLTDVSRELATKYGFTWSDPVYWGTGGLAGDEPDVVSVDNVLAVYHHYCGGLDNLSSYLEARGGAVDGDFDRNIFVSVLFKHPGSPKLTVDLDNMRSQIDNDFEASPFKPAWTDYEHDGRCVVFRDVRTVGMYTPVRPYEVGELRGWLDRHGVSGASIRLEQSDDFLAFAKAATARCTACNGMLEYLDPRIDDIEKPQLVCRACGGLYDLEAFP